MSCTEWTVIGIVHTVQAKTVTIHIHPQVSHQFYQCIKQDQVAFQHSRYCVVVNMAGEDTVVAHMSTNKHVTYTHNRSADVGLQASKGCVRVCVS